MVVCILTRPAGTFILVSVTEGGRNRKQINTCAFVFLDVWVYSWVHASVCVKCARASNFRTYRTYYSDAIGCDLACLDQQSEVEHV